MQDFVVKCVELRELWFGVSRDFCLGSHVYFSLKAKFLRCWKIELDLEKLLKSCADLINCDDCNNEKEANTFPPKNTFINHEANVEIIKT